MIGRKDWMGWDEIRWDKMIWCNMTWYDVIRCYLIRYDLIWYENKLYDRIRYSISIISIISCPILLILLFTSKMIRGLFPPNSKEMALRSIKIILIELKRKKILN